MKTKRFVPTFRAVMSLAACMFATSAANAATDTTQAAELAQKSGCMACHSMDKKVIGPAFKDVSKKYKGNTDAEAMLAKKIKDGSSGVWGPIPMPPNGPKVSDTDIKTLAAWILATH